MMNLKNSLKNFQRVFFILKLPLYSAKNQLIRARRPIIHLTAPVRCFQLTAIEKHLTSTKNQLKRARRPIIHLYSHCACQVFSPDSH